MGDKPEGRLKYAESDSPVQRTVIGAFLDAYNAYYRATRGVDVDHILAEMILDMRALMQLGEVDESVCEAFEAECRELSEKITKVGRLAATTIQFMHNRRNGGEGMELAEEQWPDLITEDEQ